jgi:hypothetical protein
MRDGATVVSFTLVIVLNVALGAAVVAVLAVVMSWAAHEDERGVRSANAVVEASASWASDDGPTTPTAFNARHASSCAAACSRLTARMPSVISAVAADSA